MSTAATYESFENIDTVTSLRVVEVKGSSLRAGMVLVDEMDAPVAGLDHKIRANRGSGSVAFLIADLEKGGWAQHSFHSNKMFRVVAK